MKVFCFLALIILVSCAPKTNTSDLEALKQEVLNVERAFSAMASSDGVENAFLHYAADSVVLQRGGILVHGKEEMKQYFDQQTLQNVQLIWEPSFADVSASGDLGYTYGTYQFSAVDTAGTPIQSGGFFHTVWKRQSDGSWKFVYD